MPWESIPKKVQPALATLQKAIATLLHRGDLPMELQIMLTPPGAPPQVHRLCSCPRRAYTTTHSVALRPTQKLHWDSDGNVWYEVAVVPLSEPGHSGAGTRFVVSNFVEPGDPEWYKASSPHAWTDTTPVHEARVQLGDVLHFVSVVGHGGPGNSNVATPETVSDSRCWRYALFAAFPGSVGSASGTTDVGVVFGHGGPRGKLAK